MKQQAIIFSTHDTGSNLAHLIKEAKARGQTITEKGQIAGFSPSEGAQHVFIPETRRNAYGIKETDAEYPGFVNEILSQMDMGEG